jgi:hypothetical protein
MAGNTAIIDRATLKAQWDSYQSLQSIAAYWTVSSHQLIRLRVVWGFEPRNDRKRRYKPSRSERLLDPDAAELEASESTLDLAPLVAERVTVIHAWWTPRDWEERRAVKDNALSLAAMPVPDEARGYVDDLNRGIEW